MRRSRVVRALGLVVASSLMAVACANEAVDDVPETEPEEAADDEPEEEPEEASEEAAEQDDEFLIGVSFPNSTGTLYVEMAAGIEDLAPELGANFIINYAEEDQIQQLNDVDTLLAQGVDAILISPIDFDGVQPAYEAAQAQGIPIISVARSTDPELQVSFVGAPWEDFGLAIAEWTCEATDGEGQVAMLMGPAGASFVDDMERGYKSYMDDECPGIEIVFETHVVPMTPDQALPVAQDALAAFPDIDVIYSQLDDMVPGVNAVLEEQGRLGEVIVTGFDGTPDAFDAIREGRQDMTIALHPYRWGQRGFETVVRYLRGEDIDDFVEIETTLIDRNNIDQFDDEDLR